MEFCSDIHLDVYVEEEGYDERAFISVNKDSEVTAGDYCIAGQPDSSVLFELIRRAKVLTFNGKHLKSFILQEAEDNEGARTGAIEVWLCF